jgi:hypothetical protein
MQLFGIGIRYGFNSYLDYNCKRYGLDWFGMKLELNVDMDLILITINLQLELEFTLN